MKKTKLKRRIKNSIEAFFNNDQETNDENCLSSMNEFELLKQKMLAASGDKADLLIKLLKQTFIFLPGALYLFFAAMFGVSFQFFWEKPWLILVVFLIGSFMTIFGIGNLKNPKHLAIPLSIVAVGLMAFSLFSMFGKLKYLIEYGIYFFPLALIVPILARNFVDQPDSIKSV